MAKLLKAEGIYQLLGLAFGLEKGGTNPDKILESVKNNPNFLLDLMPDSDIYVVNLENTEQKKIILEDIHKEKKQNHWTEETAPKFIELLELTVLQTNILLTIYKKNNVPLEFLIEKNKHLFKYKSKKEAAIIGGAINGLRRKCVSSSIDIPILSDRDALGILKYSLIAEKEVFIKYLK